MINKDRRFCYRICHIDNLSHILQFGLCTKHHKLASRDFKPIGNTEIISVRDETIVRLPDYGTIGEYIPFYFTPRSIMLYNIVTGYWAPKVPRVPRNEILVIRCYVSDLIKLPRYFFTDGQANDALTNHYVKVEDSKNIDWSSIQNSNFSKSDGDFDRPRRYQAEFLVHEHVPLEFIESLHVYDEKASRIVKAELENAGLLRLNVNVTENYFF